MSNIQDVTEAHLSLDGLHLYNGDSGHEYFVARQHVVALNFPPRGAAGEVLYVHTTTGIMAFREVVLDGDDPRDALDGVMSAFVRGDITFNTIENR